MKVGIFTEANKKGQIVIPKVMRDSLGINENVLLNIIQKDGGVYIYPVSDVITKIESEDSYSKVLDKTRGAWRFDKGWKKREKEIKRIEIAAARRNKKLW